MIERTSPDSLAELASMHRDAKVVYFGVGIESDDALLVLVAGRLEGGEKAAVIAADAGCFEELERPSRTPAVGAWCSKGMLVGYGTDEASVLELMENARRFS